MLLWAPVILQFDVAPLRLGIFSFLAPFVSGNTCHHEEREMYDSTKTQVSISPSTDRSPFFLVIAAIYEGLAYRINARKTLAAISILPMVYILG